MAAEPTRRTALITGATGYIGSHLARRLVSDGWAVHAIVRAGSRLEPLQSFLPRITLHMHDGTIDGMNAIVHRTKPDVVFHLASLVLTRHQPKDVGPMLESNVVFGTQLVEAMLDEGVFALVTTGTSWQHYENRAYSPVCLYAATKQAFDALLTYYTDATLLKAITLKLFDTYGPLDPRPKILNLLRDAAFNRRPLEMTAGEQLIDLVHVDDVVNAYTVAAKRLLAGIVNRPEAYAVSSGRPVRLRELVRLYEEACGVNLQIAWGALPYRPREVMFPWIRGRRLPGWWPTVGLDEGLKSLGPES